MSYNIHTLNNGIRILHLPNTMPISYVGVAVDAGTRDELPDESGMAHFVEHLLFKGTKRRRAWHIINRLESVGGQLDAYTTKDETYICHSTKRIHRSCIGVVGGCGTQFHFP